MKNQIYQNLKKVPKGKVITYKALANSINSKAYRFVGTCMKNNTDPVSIPCYKVVLSNGDVGNYSAVGGIRAKVKKLENEGIEVKKGKVNLKKFGFKF